VKKVENFPQTGSISVVNALLFDVDTGALNEGSIRIVDGIIEEMGTSVGTGESVLDARANVVTPGLIDCHFHAYAIGVDSRPGATYGMAYVAFKARQRLERALRRGFTTVRDPAGGDRGLARAIREGLILAPNYFYSSSALSQTGGHGDYRDPEDSLCQHSGRDSVLVDTPDEIRLRVRENFRQGASFIKMMTSGGVVSPADPLRTPQFSPEEIAAAVDEATRRGTYVTAHSYSPESIIHSVENGIRCIEHGNLVDKEGADLMSETGTYLVPTLTAYDAMQRLGPTFGLGDIYQAKNREVLASGLGSIEIAATAGVKIGFGSDLMGPLETEQLRGIALQTEVMGIAETLRAATAVNSELLPDDRFGRLRIGVPGDLVIWDGNPLEDPSAVFDPARERTVVKGGVVV
jgi:imidazolonepropionase-like amidohydrolase